MESPIALRRAKHEPHEALAEVEVHIVERVGTLVERGERIEIDCFAMVGSLLPKVLARIPDNAGLAGVSLRTVFLDPHSKQYDRRQAVEKYYRKKTNVEQRISECAIAIFKQLHRLGLKSQDVVKWFDGSPPCFLLRIGKGLYFHAYSETLEGDEAVVYFYEDNTREAFARDLVESFETMWNGHPFVRSFSPHPNPVDRPRALSLDLDGTLLDTYGKTPDHFGLDQVESYLRNYKRENPDFRIVACTGRSRAFVEGILSSRFAQCFTDFVFENGCVVTESIVGPNKALSDPNMKCLSEDSFGMRMLRFVERHLRIKSLPFEYCKEHLLTFRESDLQEDFRLVTRLLDSRAVRQGAVFEKQQSGKRGNRKVDVAPSGVSKLSGIIIALQKSGDRGGIGLNEVMHIGDAANDLPILHGVGWRGLVPGSGGKLASALIQFHKELGARAKKKTVVAEKMLARGTLDILLKTFGDLDYSQGKNLGQ